MSNPTIERVRQQPVNLITEQVERLREIFPEAFSEDRIDFDKLKATLGEIVDDRQERYSFNWAGKRDALRALQTPTWGTLKPNHEASSNFETTQHLFIEGENLEVLKLLRKSYFGRIKLIYLDPPYNTGNDFVYADDFRNPKSTYLQLTGQLDEEGNFLTSNPETSGRYHSDWLSMMYPRLFIARQLLRDDGVIAISIDDTEVHNLRLLLNEIFGEENFIANVVWQKRYVSNVTAQFISDMHDHILVFARNRSLVKVNKIKRTEQQLADYKNPDNDPRGPWRAQDLSASKPYSAGLYTIVTPAGLEVTPPPGRYWRCSEEQYQAWVDDNRIWFGVQGTARPMLKAFLSEVQGGLTPNTWWDFEFAGHNKEATLEMKALFDGSAPFDTPKPVKLIRRLLEIFTSDDAIVLDFFAGSATTAHSVLHLNHEDGGNRRFIMVQLQEPTPDGSLARNMGYASVADIGKERIRRAISEIKHQREGQLSFNDHVQPEDLGFAVFDLDESHWQPWQELPSDTSPEEYAEALELFHDPLIGNWKAEDVVYEVLLREGLSLTSQVERVDNLPEDVTVWRVTDEEKEQSLLICLDARFELETARALNLTQGDLLICRDVAIDDTAAANLALQCRLKLI